MKPHYEWVCETVADGDSAQHEDGEVLDHFHADSLRDVRAWVRTYPPDPGTRYEIALTRDDDQGRSWAYLDTNALPDYFLTADGSVAAAVPKRFKKET